MLARADCQPAPDPARQSRLQRSGRPDLLCVPLVCSLPRGYADAAASSPRPSLCDTISPFALIRQIIVATVSDRIKNRGLCIIFASTVCLIGLAIVGFANATPTRCASLDCRATDRLRRGLLPDHHGARERGALADLGRAAPPTSLSCSPSRRTTCTARCGANCLAALTNQNARAINHAAVALGASRHRTLC